VLARGQKKNQFKKTNRKKMINIIKTVCNHDATTGVTDTDFRKFIKKQWCMRLQ